MDSALSQVAEGEEEAGVDSKSQPRHRNARGFQTLEHGVASLRNCPIYGGQTRNETMVNQCQERSGNIKHCGESQPQLI